MSFGVNSGAAQGTSLPPVEDADIKPQPTQQDTGSEKQSADPKTGKQQAQSQPTETEQQSKEGQQQESQQAKEKGPGPWDAKLQELGLTDPKFSDFLRTEVQPYVTQLEQGGQGEVDPQIQEQAQLWQELQNEFSQDPETAYRELGELLGLTGDEEALGVDGDPDDADENDDGEVEDDPRLSYVDEIMQRERQAKEDQEYNSFLDEMGKRMPGFDGDLFTHFVLAYQGDLDAALTTYEKYHKAPDPTDPPPPSLDGGGSPPSASPKYGSIGDAMEAFLVESRASSPKK